MRLATRYFPHLLATALLTVGRRAVRPAAVHARDVSRSLRMDSEEVVMLVRPAGAAHTVEVRLGSHTPLSRYNAGGDKAWRPCRSTLSVTPLTAAKRLPTFASGNSSTSKED